MILDPRGEASRLEYGLLVPPLALGAVFMIAWAASGAPDGRLVRSAVAAALAAPLILTTLRRARRMAGQRGVTLALRAWAALISLILLLWGLGELGLPPWLVAPPASWALFGALVVLSIGAFDPQAGRPAIYPRGSLPSRLKRRREMTLLLAPGGDGATKLGGAPDALGFEWPMAPDGAPLPFLAQIDLAEAAAAGGPAWLPTSGRLLFFAEVGWREGGWRVLLTEAAQTPTIPLAHPRPERPARLQPASSYPTPEWLGLDLQDFEDEDLEDAIELAAGLYPQDHPEHRLGGFPSELQGDSLALAADLGLEAVDYDRFDDSEARSKATAAAVRRWRLLLQIDHDRDAGIDLSGGRLFFLVRPKAAQAGDFSGVWMLIEYD